MRSGKKDFLNLAGLLKKTPVELRKTKEILFLNTKQGGSGFELRSGDIVHGLNVGVVTELDEIFDPEAPEWRELAKKVADKTSSAMDVIQKVKLVQSIVRDHFDPPMKNAKLLQILRRQFRDDGKALPLSYLWKMKVNEPSILSLSSYMAMTLANIPVRWGQMIDSSTRQSVSLPLLETSQGFMALDINERFNFALVETQKNILDWDPWAPGVSSHQLRCEYIFY